MQNNLSKFIRSFTQVPEKEIIEFSQHFKKIELSKGQILHSQGYKTDKLYFLERGLVRFYFNNEDGKEYTKSFIRPGILFGPTHAQVKGIPSFFSMDVIEDSIIYETSYKELDKRVSTKHHWALFAMKFITEIFLIKEQREYEFLSLPSEQRYIAFSKHYSDILESIPLKYVASYLGITSVQLSRIRAKINKC